MEKRTFRFGIFLILIAAFTAHSSYCMDKADHEKLLKGEIHSKAAQKHRSRGELPESNRELMQARENGHQGAIFELAENYYFGRGVPQDYEKAFNLYGEIRETNYKKHAYFRVSVMSAFGQGIPKNREKALELLGKSVQYENKGGAILASALKGAVNPNNTIVIDNKSFKFYSYMGAKSDEEKNWLSRELEERGFRYVDPKEKKKKKNKESDQSSPK